MRKTLRKIILFILIFIGITIISNSSNASGGLRLKNLNYDVKLNEDGTADVTETWKIRIEDTNTLFKTFEVDTSKYKEITDVKVSEIKSAGEVNFTKTNQYSYHVNKNYYYGLMHNGKFEIAWGAHAEDITKTYKISYKIVDAVKNYKDCSEFYWKFINTESEIPANLVTGTIILPHAVQNKEDLRTWAHGPLNGNIEIISNNTIKFEVENLNENTMLETRVVTPSNVFSANQNISQQNKLNSILSQEQTWANEANARRDKLQAQAKRRKILIILALVIFNIIGILITIKVIKKIIEYRKILNETPKLKPEEEFEYYREIPDEKETPAGAAFLHYFKHMGITGYRMPQIISATMLDLCMKKYVEFEVLPETKDQIKVKLKKDSADELPEDEKVVYELLQKISKKEDNSFTMKEFEKYSKNNSSKVLNEFNKIERKVKEREEKEGNYSKELIKKSSEWTTKGVGYVILAFISMVCMWILVIPAFIAAIYCCKIAPRLNTLTQKGVNEKEKWNKLKKYMEEFSMIKDKTVPELILWEKYLVYATAFGIANKVLKQLKVVYPQIDNISNEYTYLYLMYSPRFTNSFITTLSNSITTSYNTTTSYTSNYSSGSGFGGGFSSGGGFGRWRRPEWEVDKKNILGLNPKYIFCNEKF